MRNEQDPKEKLNQPEEAETVRCIIENTQGKILVLQKSPNSKAPGLFEFPGGKIDDIAGLSSSSDEQIREIIKEVQQETGLDISGYNPRRFDEFSYQFLDGDRVARKKVHMFFVYMSATEADVSINTAKDPNGESEDKHSNFVFVTREELIQLRQEGKLIENSQYFEKTLDLGGNSEL